MPADCPAPRRLVRAGHGAHGAGVAGRRRSQMREPPRASARERTARPSDEKILAAIRRAALHEGAEHGGATARPCSAHLAIPPRAARARGVRAALGELEGRGLTESWRRRGIERWRLSPAGASLLAAAARDGRLPVLPEAPQHRAWRDARAAANEELPRFAAALASDLDDASAMLARLRRRGRRAALRRVAGAGGAARRRLQADRLRPALPARVGRARRRAGRPRPAPTPTPRCGRCAQAGATSGSGGASLAR